MGIRLTGLDTPIAGLSWEVAKDDAESAFKIIKYMEDKRVYITLSTWKFLNIVLGPYVTSGHI